MLVIGTAGHIDHGKSSIVKRLTGTDPDRLPEEQARGMTIDLGFAFYQAPDDQTIAFVDVPGHERFVKNMIAGAGGIDAVMLVIAADDGWMPQSEEHFQIVKLLGVKHGVIALNKCDLVEPDWLQLLEKELRSRLAGSFLSGAPIFRLSATTGSGFAQLSEYLNGLPTTIAAKRDIGKARLYIDRVFLRQGIGGVVTGTLRGGSLSVGQSVSIWPSGKVAKIRSLQSHNEEADAIAPGGRTAVTLSGVEKSELVRGGVVSARTNLEYFHEHPVLALQVQMLPNAAVPLEDRRRLLLIIGTTEVEGEVRMFDQPAVAAGGTGLVFFRPDEPVYCLVNDRGILRLPTPMLTLGGAVVLDHLASFPRRKELEALSYLQGRGTGEPTELVVSELRKLVLAREVALLENADLSGAEIAAALARLEADGTTERFQEYWYLRAVVKRVTENIREAIAGILKQQPHLKGVTLAQVSERVAVEATTAALVLDHMMANGEITRSGDYFDLAGRGVALKGIHKEAYDKIMAALRADPIAPPSLQSFASQGKQYQEAIRVIIETKAAHKCGAEFLVLEQTWRDVIAFIRSRLAATGQFAVTELRDKFGFSRKYAIPILEETDRLRLTERQGDIRVKGVRFDHEDFAA